MKRSSLIGHLVELVDLFRGARQPADRILKQYYRARGYLGSKDRRFISESYFGLLRNFSLVELLTTEAFRLSGSTARGTESPSVALLATYFVRVRHEEADSLRLDVAALWRKAARDLPLDSFFAALLSVSVPDQVKLSPGARIAAEQSFPEWLVDEWISTFGLDEAEHLCRALNEPAPVTMRVNLLRCTVGECREALAREGLETVPTRFSPVGLILPKRIDANTLRIFRQGWFEMQDEASQLIVPLLEVAAGDCVIDACAGGGGKTLHIGAQMGNRGRIVAIDSDEKRLAEVGNRALRAGLSIVERLHAGRDAGSILTLTGQASAVLIDAPCSGAGSVRRNPGGKLLITPESVKALVEVQRSILERYAPLVRPGGRLVYSTCTLVGEENERQIRAFLSHHPEFILRNAEEILSRQGIALDGQGEFLMLLPHRTGTDGFFAAVVDRAR